MKVKSLMNGMKFNYIKAFLFCMCLTLSAPSPSFAQKQKKEKQKKEQTAKPKKQSNTKQRLIEFATEKVAKKGTLAYNAQREAARIAMDSIMRFTRTKDESEKHFGEYLQQDYVVKFADLLCAKFDNDPVFMDSVASGFYTIYGDAFLGEKRFAELKQLHPNFVDAYYTEALLFHTLAWAESSTSYNPEFLRKAKEQIDSAKLIVPNDPEPYMKWVRWQGKYDPEGITGEIDTLKMKIPNYPGYLEVARDFDRYSENDRRFLPSAKAIYKKAERDAMKPQDFSGYSLVCYRVGDIQKLKEDFEEGVAVANEGMARFPDYPYLLRMKLWNQGGMTTVPRIPSDEKKIMWDSLYVTSQAFKELPDSFQRLSNDYRWMAQASMETKHYSEAIKLFKQQLEAGVTDSIQYALALRNMVDCYTNLELYDDAEKAYFRFEGYKKEKSMEMTITDYQKLFLVYYYQGGDTLNMAPDRKNYFQKADSLLAIMGEVSPENIGYVNNTRLQIALQLAGLEGSDYSYPPVLEAANRLVKSMLAVSESEREPNDWYYMMRGMRYAMEHYIFADLKGEAWVCADEILGLPMSMELTGMSSSRAKEYDQHTSRAESVLGYNTYATPGKKLKKTWRPFR